MMKIARIILIIFFIFGITASTLGCDTESDQAENIENQIVTVQRGDLIIDITAAGNLALSRTEDLAFDIFYEEAAVEEVMVEEGDTVEEGQLLATLDTEEWDEELSALEDQVATAERNLLQAEINLSNAEIDLDEAEDIYTWPEIEVAQAEVDNAEAFLEYVLEKGLSGAILSYAGSRLAAAEAKLDAMVMDYDTEQVAVKKLELELAQGRLEDAGKALEDAQEALDDAESESPNIIAPFDGFITMVNVEGGDEVLTGTVAVQLADPAKFEADIMVGEVDIFQVQLGGEAWVEVDAKPGLGLPAKVTHISPTATIQSGVVNYEVKVEVSSLQDSMKQRMEVAQELMENIQLREGLTVTVSILIDTRTNVLLVPNNAITRRGMESYVQVQKGGVMEERAIETGISDWQFTEVISGLSGGEQVVVPKTTATTNEPGTTRPAGRIGFPPH